MGLGGSNLCKTQITFQQQWKAISARNSQSVRQERSVSPQMTFELIRKYGGFIMLLLRYHMTWNSTTLQLQPSSSQKVITFEKRLSLNVPRETAKNKDTKPQVSPIELLAQLVEASSG